MSGSSRTSVATFASFAGDSYSQAGTGSFSLARSGAFAAFSYSFGSLVFQSGASQLGTYQASGADTFASVTTYSSTTWTNQGPVAPFGNTGIFGATNIGLGSFTTTDVGWYCESGAGSWSQNSNGSASYSLYEAGSYALGSYALSSGGLDYGLVFGGSKTVLRGRVSNIYRPSDVAGVYGAAGAGLAVGGGARAIVLTNQKGAVLELSGRQVGLMANADLSGLAITLR